jgi:N-acylneuraminate cytidylyltransferase
MYKNKSIIAIIPARGGSKGIPKKNIKLLNNKPLVVYSILNALQSKYIDEVFVSTDDKAIALIAEQYGAKVINRPKSLSSDTSTSESALRHAVQEIEKIGMKIDLVVFLQATSPIREKYDLDKAIEKFIKEKLDSLFSAQRSYFHIWEEKLNRVIPITYDFKARARRQDRSLQWHENGSFYIFKKDILIKNNNRLGGKIGIYSMPSANSFEIDSYFDWFLLEQIIKLREKPNKFF